MFMPPLHKMYYTPTKWIPRNLLWKLGLGFQINFFFHIQVLVFIPFFTSLAKVSDCILCMLSHTWHPLPSPKYHSSVALIWSHIFLQRFVDPWTTCSGSPSFLVWLSLVGLSCTYGTWGWHVLSEHVSWLKRPPFLVVAQWKMRWGTSLWGY